jgi:DNA-binding PadR family transcriptional regulator
MTVRHTLLGLLAQQPRYGYELRAAFTALAGGRENWEVAPAQIYTTLNRMLKSGLIQVKETADGDSSERQFFTITTTGMDELNQWFASEERTSPVQDTFYLKLMVARDLPFVETASLIQTQRTSAYRELRRITRQRSELDPRTDLARILLMDKAIMHLEADLRWLDMIEARLEEINLQPAPEPELRPRGRPPTLHNNAMKITLKGEKNVNHRG